MRIRLQGVEKRYGRLQAVKPIHLTIEDTFVTILGQSGCGKTTLLKMIAGLTDPTSGEIWFDEQVIFSKEKKINVKPNQRQIGMVFQDFGLWPHMTVFENMPIEIYYPQSGTVVSPRAAAILADAQNVEGAQAFIDFLLSDQAQKMVADAYLLPGNGDIELNHRAALKDIPTLPVDWENAEEKQVDTLNEFVNLIQK